MSGAQIGTVIGGAIGAYFGGPAGAQLGMAIGGTIGGAIDPTKINGPRIGDGQQQTATDGSPIAWVLGTATVAGTLVQVGPRRQVKIKDSGKGGPVVSHYEARRDFAILVCESCSLRSSTMDAVLMVQQDGNIVYDVRAGSPILAQSAKWKANVDFLFGDEAQLPHPTLEAITGVGNTPSYRGSLLAVFKSFNVTAAGDRVPSFQFTVASSATQNVTPQTLFRSYAVAGGISAGLMDTHAGVLTPFTPSTLPTIVAFSTRADASPAALNPIRSIVKASEFGVTLWDSGWVGSATVAVELEAYLAIHHPELSGASFNTSAAYNKNITVGTGITSLYQSTYCYGSTAGSGILFVSGFVIQSVPVLPDETPGTVSLDALVSAICLRGGLTAGDIDVTGLAGTVVYGYPMARQGTATDMLGPLLQAYFAYGSEYDGKIHFQFYGANASITVSDDDLLEASDANDGNVTSDTRSQATEFPRKITASYMDPAQNYTPVNVSVERLAVDVVAIGEQAFSIPVVMPADQAKRAADKAMKVAYATLEGKQEYSVPFARSATYLSLCAGDPVIFRGKRWVIDEAVLGAGYLKLSTRYDRQSAYTSTIQAIVGNAPSIPSSPYSGPTTLMALNLPALRPQDTYGLYLAAASTTGSDSWRGCTVQVSYDNQVTWQNATTITQASTLGSVLANEPGGGEPLTVQVNDDLFTVTDDQIAAQANAFAVQHASGDEIGQFKTATEDGSIVDKYTLTNVTRGARGTARVSCVAGENFTMLDSVYFLPISPTFAGNTIYLRGVGFGEVAEDADVISVVFDAIAPPDYTIYDRIDEDGNLRIDEDGNQRVSY